jgi:sugar phosphate isomerase/epimerase
MNISAFLTSLPLGFETAVRRACALGFCRVDVVALAERPATHLEALADSGLLVACAVVGRDLPDGVTLDDPSAARRRTAVEMVQRQLADTARLGAQRAYLVSGHDGTVAGLARFAEACTLLADFASQRMVRLCVEHVPGRALPTVAAALEWLDQVGHANLSLLMDVGHCLISKEDPATAVLRAGARLGYIHFDDNDGKGDVHWPLLTGVLTEAQLRGVLSSLQTSGYEGELSLELSPEQPDPEKSLSEGKRLLEQLMRT